MRSSYNYCCAYFNIYSAYQIISSKTNLVIAVDWKELTVAIESSIPVLPSSAQKFKVKQRLGGLLIDAFNKVFLHEGRPESFSLRMKGGQIISFLRWVFSQRASTSLVLHLVTWNHTGACKQAGLSLASCNLKSSSLQNRKEYLFRTGKKKYLPTVLGEKRAGPSTAFGSL